MVILVNIENFRQSLYWFERTYIHLWHPNFVLLQLYYLNIYDVITEQ